MRFAVVALILAFFVSLPGESSELTTVSAPVLVDPYNEELLRLYWTIRYLQYLEYMRGQNQNELGNRFGDENSVKPAANATNNFNTATPPPATEQPNCKQVGERCVYHYECCSNACLFYLAKCVSR